MARLVMVSRRYWPLAGGQEVLFSSLAKGLQRRGHRVTMLTAQWATDWPTEIDDEGVRLIRLSQRRQSMWGTWSFMARLTRWLRRHRGEFDALIVSRIGYSAYAALRGVGRKLNVPAIIVSLTGSAGNDVSWLQHNPLSPRIQSRVQRASAIVASSHFGHQSLVAAGFPAERVHTIPWGIELPRAPSPAVRDESRRDLRATNKDFAVPMKGKVAITIRPLQAASNLPALLRAWKEVIEVHPDARLWVIGDGKQRDELAQLRRDLDLGWNVIMPGVFEETDELLAAADLYLADGAGHVGRLLAAMAAGLPIVAQDSPTHREMLGGAGHGSLLYDKAGPELVRAITRILDQPAQWYDAGAFHRTIVERQFSMQQMLDAYEHLLFVDSAKWLGGDIR